MEVLRGNFQEELPYIKEAIEECEFVAIDAEFSGLHTEPNRRTQNTTLEQGYEELRKSASQFLTVQIGISTFKFDPSNGQYIAKPFNFFVFPTTTSTPYAQQGRCFLTEASSLDFLAKNNFDFNKWVLNGVHYMTKAEEENYRRERTKYLNNEFEDVKVDPAYTDWLQLNVQRIKEWKDDPNAFNFVNIQAPLGYQRRLIHQELRRIWGTELQAQGNGAFMKITKATLQHDLKAQKQAAVQREIEQAIGFRKVIDFLSASKKPIVGHNIVVDLAYILAQFVGPLPPTMEGYKKMIHKTFPVVIDTKYVSYSAKALQGLAYDSNLAALENMVNSHHFIGCPKIVPNYRHMRYLRRDLSHEAGYDAFITGQILIRMLAHITRIELPPPSLQSVSPPVSPAEATSKKHSGKGANEYEKDVHYSKQNGNKSNLHGSSQHHGKHAPVSAPVQAPAPNQINQGASKSAESQKPNHIAKPPAKISYAAAAQKSKANSQQQEQQQQQQHHKQQDQQKHQHNQQLQGSPPPTNSAPLSPPREVQDNRASSGYSNGDDNDGYSDESYHEDHAPEHFNRPFSIDSPQIKSLHNVLHWGRSSHGCINLTSS